MVRRFEARSKPSPPMFPFSFCLFPFSFCLGVSSRHPMLPSSFCLFPFSFCLGMSSRRPDSSSALAPAREHIRRHAPNPTHAHTHARTRILIVLRSPTARAFRRRCVKRPAGLPPIRKPRPQRRHNNHLLTCSPDLLGAATTIYSPLTTFYCSVTPGRGHGESPGARCPWKFGRPNIAHPKAL